jgi:hypothetical protein
MSSPEFPEPTPSMPATPLSEVDAAFEKLAKKADRWVNTTVAARVALLRRCMVDTAAVGADWVDAACRLASGRHPLLSGGLPAGLGARQGFHRSILVEVRCHD